ncbi:unnamed protein product [Albugo candida]|uniref:SCP domain-containing protein n=1 Tax=Albugo candida TaxID=65357 RepID=A0A024FUP1_9STRA|nr:unnamed protein product [Albugo candida]|eukprot:CCI10868.1 unnamed protein product [Albugo candida]
MWKLESLAILSSLYISSGRSFDFVKNIYDFNPQEVTQFPAFPTKVVPCDDSQLPPVPIQSFPTFGNGGLTQLKDKYAQLPNLRNPVDETQLPSVPIVPFPTTDNGDLTQVKDKYAQLPNLRNPVEYSQLPPVPIMPSPTTDNGDPTHSKDLEVILKLINDARSENHCGKLKSSPELIQAACTQSSFMGLSMHIGHIGAHGLHIGARVQLTGLKFSAVAENVAKGQPDMLSLHDSFMNSDGHRANIMNCAYDSFGFCPSVGKDQEMYYTQTFAKTLGEP